MQYITACAACKHQRELLNGWKTACDAFPDGIPMDYSVPYDKLKEPCNNGIGFEVEDEELARIVLGKHYEKLIS